MRNAREYIIEVLYTRSVKTRSQKAEKSAMVLTESGYGAIYQYLASGKYETGSSKNQRRIIRRKAQEHYRIENGRLFYSAISSTNTTKERTWKLVIKTEEERQRILESCHSGIGGKSKPLLVVLFSGVVTLKHNCKPTSL